MDLLKKESTANAVEDVSLNTLLQPTNGYVISTIPVTKAQYRAEPMVIEAIGYTAYNTSFVGLISSRASGRIEQLYVKYRYQLVSKGQKILELYSPELLTAQENLLFLLKNDALNASLINSARQRLLLLGMSDQQLSSLIARRKAFFTITIYSNYSGHIHEATGGVASMPQTSGQMQESLPVATQELTLKEGMYVQKGQTIFSVYDPTKLWGILNISQADQPYVKRGDEVQITSEADARQSVKRTISYIEPVFRQGSKTVTARVTMPNTGNRIPVGAQLRAHIFTQPHTGWWLPKEAVLSLGLNKVALVKKGKGFVVRKVITGHTHPQWIQIIEGLAANDSVAMNAQYLMDSEGFIKINER
jgi:Cu(I)/Ag(I) efflux system membrane fusion protein